MSSAKLAKIRSASPEHNWEKWYQLKPGNVYVEAGAFWGRYGRIASLKVGDTGKVVLIEPSPINIDLIQTLISAENLANVTLIQKAVWDTKGTQKLNVEGNSASHRLTFPNAASVVTVETDTIDNILSDLNVSKVDLLACDVEGAEVELMKGCAKYLNERRILHFAIGAYHAPGNPEAVMKILREANFTNLSYEEGVVYTRG